MRSRSAGYNEGLTGLVGRDFASGNHLGLPPPERPYPVTLVVNLLLFRGAMLVTRHQSLTLLAAAVLSLAVPTLGNAVPIGYHWQTQGHFHPPELAVGWYPIFHWVTDQGPHSFDPGHGTFSPGFVASGGSTINAPASFGTNMFGVSLMDEHMNIVVHRGTEDLTLLHHAWTLERVTPDDDGYVFHLNELSEITTDGFSSTLIAPVAIPLTLISLTPDADAGPGIYDGFFQGTIPVGALGSSMVEPLFSTGNPFVLYNELAAPFELTLQIAVPEPSSVAIFTAGLCTLALLRLSGNRGNRQRHPTRPSLAR